MGAYGYGNPVLTISITGAQIDAALKEQWKGDAFAPFGVSANVSYTYDPDAPEGNRVDPAEVLVDGAPLDVDKTYRVAVLAYTAIGGDGTTAFEGFTEPHRNEPSDREAFVKYIEEHKSIAPAPLDRVHAK